jgi:large subunit ribosomal protein L25
MDQVKLRAETGRELGSRPARRLRREGLVPAVVYGRGAETVSVAVDKRDLYRALTTEAGANVLINLEVGKEKLLTVAREVQRHPVRNEITHLDFIRISLDEAIQAEVGIEFIGVPIGVREDGGIVDTISTSVTINALPTDIPSSIEVDISELNVGDTIFVEALPALEGVEMLTDPETPLASVVIPAAVEAAVTEEEELEGELLEGEEGELVEGEEGAEEAADSEDEG